MAALLVADEVTYAKGEAPRVPRDVDVAPQQALQEGALPVYTTIWTGVPWSDLQMERRLFMLEIQTAFRYVDGLLESLREAGRLARREAPPEWRPVLVPSLIVGDSHRLVPTTDGPPCGIQRMLPSGNWVPQMNSAAGPLRDAAHIVARQIALAWSEELSMLLDHGPDLSRLGPQVRGRS